MHPQPVSLGGITIPSIELPVAIEIEEHSDEIVVVLAVKTLQDETHRVALDGDYALAPRVLADMDRCDGPVGFVELQGYP